MSQEEAGPTLARAGTFKHSAQLGADGTGPRRRPCWERREVWAPGPAPFSARWKPRSGSPLGEPPRRRMRVARRVADGAAAHARGAARRGLPAGSPLPERRHLGKGRGETESGRDFLFSRELGGVD